MRFVYIVFALFFLAMGAFSCQQAFAHVDPVTKEDYSQWKRNDGKGSCCSDYDCKPTQARWNAEKGQWEARFGEFWVLIPHDKVLKHAAKDGNPHLCAQDYYGVGDWGGPPPDLGPNTGQHIFVFCFTAPEAKG